MLIFLNCKAAAGLVEKLAEITEENAGRSGETIPARLNDAITLDHVTFGYKPEEPVLNDLSLRLEAGKKYALVGASGSGKSTLLNLLMGAYDGYDGSIAIDGGERQRVSIARCLMREIPLFYCWMKLQRRWIIRLRFQ